MNSLFITKLLCFVILVITLPINASDYKSTDSSHDENVYTRYIYDPSNSVELPDLDYLLTTYSDYLSDHATRIHEIILQLSISFGHEFFNDNPRIFFAYLIELVDPVRYAYPVELTKLEKLSNTFVNAPWGSYKEYLTYEGYLNDEGYLTYVLPYQVYEYFTDSALIGACSDTELVQLNHALSQTYQAALYGQYDAIVIAQIEQHLLSVLSPTCQQALLSMSQSGYGNNTSYSYFGDYGSYEYYGGYGDGGGYYSIDKDIIGPTGGYGDIGGGAPPSYRPPPRRSVYNLSFDPLKREDPIVLHSDRPIDMAFDIGPKRSKNVLPLVEVDERIREMAAGEMTSITVRMVCGVCEEDATQSQDIDFDPVTEKSTVARFEIKVSRELAQRQGGLGNINLSLFMHGFELNQFALDVFVDEVEPAALAQYKEPRIEFIPLPANPGNPPDLVISVTPERGDGREVAVIVNPILAELAESLQPLVFEKDGSLRKFTLDFTGADYELTRVVRDAYKRLRQMVHPDNKERSRLKQIYEAQGVTAFDRSWPSTAVELIPQHRKLALLTFKEVGQDLYRTLLSDLYGGRGLREALKAVESFKTKEGRPLRISINTQYFLPWQLFYPNFEDQGDTPMVDADKFWGFKYELAVRQIVRGQNGRLNMSALQPKFDDVVFAKGRSLAPGDPIEGLADGLAAQLFEPYSHKDPVPIVDTDQSFMSSLEKNVDELALVVLFSHGRSGSHLIWDSNAPITLSDDIGPRLLFADKQMVTPRRIERIYDRIGVLPVWSNAPIFVLNACETGTGGADPSNNGLFVTTLMRLGAGAVIVTESEVWTQFGAAWAKTLIEEMAEGHAMPEAVLNARRFHLDKNNNPMGLLYSYYGNTSARIEFPNTTP